MNLSEEHREVLEYLLSQPFEGRDALRAQLDSCRVTKQYEAPWEFDLEVHDDTQRAVIERHIPVEAHLHDVELARTLGVSNDSGGLIELWLKVYDGKLAGVEQIFGLPIEMYPKPLPPLEDYELKVWHWVIEPPEAL